MKQGSLSRKDDEGNKDSVSLIFQNSIKNLRYREGIKEVEKEIRRHPELADAPAFYKLGFLSDHAALYCRGAKKKKEFEEKAIAFYKCSLKINPDYYNAIWGIGRVWWHRNSVRAIPYAVKAYELHKKETGSNSFAQNVGSVYADVGDYRNAEKWFKKALRDGKKENIWAYLALVKLYGKEGAANKEKKYRRMLSALFKKQSIAFRKGSMGDSIARVLNQNGL